MKYLSRLLISILLLFAVLFLPNLASAQEDTRTNIFNELVDALNNETTNIYDDYYYFSSKYEDDESLFSNFFEDLNTHVESWVQIAKNSKTVYEKYLSNKDQEISLIANKALIANKRVIEAINYYKLALSSEDENISNNHFDSGDKAIAEAYTLHDEAVELYNDLSGTSSSLSARNWLIFFSVLSVFFSLLLFFKSRKKSQLEAEKIRAEVYKGLLLSSLWMTGGLIITTVGFSYVLKEGGTYYIFYGPILIGGWQLLKGFYYYLTEGRKVLNHLNLIQKNEAIRESYSVSEKEDKILGYVCPYCGFKHSTKSVICKNCGENIL